MKTLNFLLLCLILTTNASSIAKTPIGSAKKFCIATHWTVYIYNLMNEPFTIHIKSRNDDLGSHTLGVNENENWGFCENFWGTTLFWVDIFFNGTWKTSWHAWDHIVGLQYGSGHGDHRILVWLVKEDGIYVGKSLPPFPVDGWTKLYNWP
ncbi:plant self-incompatibility S1 [Artemisia annua]|uniref:S-protein homolog n=1 Tax=Artemisia annua TaxID=35608 RepID=A0A2U1PTL2_ARTAN|nr:plant self-incompatibility S1 [Artemisia annua]